MMVHMNQQKNIFRAPMENNFQFSIFNFQFWKNKCKVFLYVIISFLGISIYVNNSILCLPKNETSQSVDKIKLGIDILIESDFEILKNKNILLLTNNTGRTSSGELTVKAFLNTKKCKIIGLLTPEHGFYTTVPAGETVNDDKIFGLPTYSLYGNCRKPDPKILKECNAVVIDIQDIGIRSYTYISTIFKTMQSCAQNNLPVYILDRPNPLGGDIVDGNIVEKGKESFVGIVPISYIHGCTVGELAQMFNEEGWLAEKGKKEKIKCNLTVIKMQNWKRSMTFEDTGLTWYPTSPNIPTVNSIRGAAVLGIFGELGIISIGIGTTLPFQFIGAPDFNTEEVINEIKNMDLKGMQFSPIKFQPSSGMYSGKQCDGFLITFSKVQNFSPYSDGIKFFTTLSKKNPNLFGKTKLTDRAIDMFNKVTGTNEILKALINHKSIDEILKISNSGLIEYKAMRKKYLLY
jgi:uncharacterized protein YbbC (DUF1343 family)